jgi:membrane protease YdiL (CAAX protease family)
MDEKFEIIPDATENVLPKRSLSWVELVIVLGGVAVIYLILSLGTLKLMEVWPHERPLIYLNAFMTQFSLVLLIWVIKKVRHWEWSDFGWHAVSLKSIFGRVVSVYLLSWVVNICYVLILYQHGLTPPTSDVYSELLGNTTWYTLILNLLLAGVLAPLVEETLFRGIVFQSLRTYCGKWTAIVISAAIFSGLHLQLYGFFTRFVLGIALAYLYDKYKSLYPSVTLHALNNIVATLMAAGLTL